MGRSSICWFLKLETKLTNVFQGNRALTVGHLHFYRIAPDYVRTDAHATSSPRGTVQPHQGSDPLSPNMTLKAYGLPSFLLYV